MSNNNNLKRLNILLRTISKINQQLVISNDEKKLCQKICHHLVKIKGYKFVWMGLNETGNDKLTPIAIAGKDKVFVKYIKNSWNKYGFNSCPTGMALKSGKHFVIEDLKNEERFVPWDKIAISYGFLSALVLPVKYHNDVIGTLQIYSDIKNYFLEEEVSFLKEVTGDISIGIKSIRDERKLIESKREYEELFKRISSCVAIYKAKDNGNDFIFKDFNKAAEKADKIKREDVIGKSVLKVFPGVKDFGLFNVFKRVYKTGKPENYPISIYKDKRISGWRENFVYKLPNGNVVAVYNDLTEKKLAEEELIMANERLALAQKSACAGVWDWDINTEKLNWSPEFYILFGLDPKKDTSTFDTWRRILHPEDKQRAEEKINESIKEKKPLFNEYRVVLPSGKIRWINALGNTIYDEHGKAVRMSGICIDITEKKKSEEESKSLAKFPEENPNLVGRIDYHGKLLYRNYIYKKIFNDNDNIPFKLQGAIKKIAAEKIFKQENIEIEIGDRIFLFNLIPIKEEGYINFYGRDITELKKAQENIIASEAKYRTLFDNSNEGILIAETETQKFKYANPAICQMFGYTEKELISMDITAIHRKEDLQSVLAVFQDQISGINPLATDIPCLKKDGTIFFADINTTNIVIDGQKCSAGFFRNITERKSLEEALRTSEEKFSKAFYSSPQGLTITTLDDNKIIEVNNTYVDIFGYSREEAIGHTSFELGSWVNPDDRVGIINSLNEKGFLHNKEVEARTKSGDIIMLLLSAELLDVEGKAHMLSTFYNITDRKKSEKALRESEKNLRMAQRLAKIGSWSWIVATDTVQWSEELCQINGHDPKLSAPNFFEEMSSFYTPESWERLNKAVTKALNNGESYELDLDLIRTDGSIIRTIARGEVDYDTGGKIIGLKGTVQDITKRKKVEEEIVYLSFHDQLTGLYNRRFFEEELKRLDTKRQFPLSIIMGDINGLKIINDVFGHTEGDELLKEIAEILRGACRSDDILARWGGDEFVMLLPKTSIIDSEEIVKRVKEECKKTNSQKIPISFSLGAAQKETASQGIQTVIIDAESNMYKNKLTEKQSISSSIIFALDQTLYEKSNETKEHTDRIHDLAIRLGKSVNLHASQLDEISLLASLHDIGKVAIPEKILLKKGSLTEKEWAIVKRHPEIGFNIAQASPQISHIAKSILSCHENFDGSGYPLGINGASIPIISRIILIADAYDVMTSGRIYKNSMSKDAAVKELKRCAGTQFDPVLVDKFIEIIFDI